LDLHRFDAIVFAIHGPSYSPIAQADLPSLIDFWSIFFKRRDLAMMVARFIIAKGKNVAKWKLNKRGLIHCNIQIQQVFDQTVRILPGLPAFQTGAGTDNSRKNPPKRVFCCSAPGQALALSPCAGRH
jgi:hypothetical protein